ncbi:MAG TPA: hypothetical protein PKJ28_09125, partial [Bacteroidales bacterium]|nr:hypothetical protein [Bacteroidales bacterium]
MSIASSRLKNVFLFLISSLALSPAIMAGTEPDGMVPVTLKWEKPAVIRYDDQNHLRQLSFEGAVTMDGYGALPVFSMKV